MFNLRVALGADTVKKSDGTAINTNSLRTVTKMEDENLSEANIYSSIGGQAPIQKPAKKQAVKKQDTDLWSGLMGGLFS